MSSLYRLFNLRRSDRRILAIVGPVFALITAANVVTNAFARALYIDQNDYASLPWMFIGASIFTVVASLIYVTLIGRWSVRRRFGGLLLLALTSFAGLGALVDADPSTSSLLIYTWTTGLGQILTIQAWSFTSVVLPTRQARRLFPVFAALATLGAVVGGSLTRALLEVGQLSSLLFLAVFLLSLGWLAVGRATARISPEHDGAGAERRDLLGDFQQIGLAFESLAKIKLLGAIALLTFLLQLASVVMDFQFSSALKSTYGAEEMAGFLGLYYAAANALTLVVALAAGSRVTRLVGIGLASSSPAVVLALGAIVASAMHFLGSSLLVWVVIGTSFAERVFGFGVGRHALHAAITPVEAVTAERAKFVIDGVVYRGATILASVGVLAVGHLLVDYGVLSPVVLVTSIVAVIVGMRLGGHYRNALFDGLRKGALGEAGEARRRWGKRDVNRLVDRLLASDEVEEIRDGLALAADLHVRLSDAVMKRLLAVDDAEVTSAVLGHLAARGGALEVAELAPYLTPKSDPRVLREALRMLPRNDPSDPSCIETVQPLLRHPDETVSSLAFMWLRAVGADAASETTDDYVPLESRLVDDLSSSKSGVRTRALSQMAELGLPEHVAPLLDALGSPLLRSGAMEALTKIGRERVLPVVAYSMWDDEVDAIANVWVMRLVELFGGGEAAQLLASQIPTENLASRHQAVQSLWRLARDGELPLPPAEELKAWALRELQLLRDYELLELEVDRVPGDKARFVLTEIDLRRDLAERRAFRLLGLLYPRAAIERAFVGLRAEEQRTRSNAVELLDTVVDDPQLKALVGWAERRDGLTSLDSEAVVVMPPSAMDLGRLLEGLRDPWLERIASWAQLNGDTTIIRDQTLDRVRLLRGISLFESIPGDQLLPLAEIARPMRYRAGEIIFEEGDVAHHLYLILSGTVEVLIGGARVTTLGERECFGEMGILDDTARRSATVKALDPVECLRLERGDFDNLLELHPSLAKGVIRVLTRRLRDTTEKSV